MRFLEYKKLINHREILTFWAEVVNLSWRIFRISKIFRNVRGISENFGQFRESSDSWVSREKWKGVAQSYKN